MKSTGARRASEFSSKFVQRNGRGCIVFNHALIQWYRSGLDHISEHSDKTLDIEHGTPVVSVSLGAT